MLREKIGLDAASIGSSLIERTVRLRMKHLNLRKGREYQELLSSSEGEWHEFLESVLVNETWFFRDSHPFTTLTRLILEEWLPTHPTGKVKILSLPCSSGEEPYSIGMALLDTGICPEKYQIDAVDISDRALARAERGIFRKNSFRGKQLGFRDRYFQVIREGYLLDPIIKNSVRFRAGNILSADFIPLQPAYDYIFCRNLLIYFDRPTQEKALRIIGKLLAADGMLFVGPAELPLALEQGFISAQIPMAFACHKDPNRPVPSEASAFIKRGGRALSPTVARPRNHNRRPSRQNQSAVVALSKDSRLDLEHARRLADAGRLLEAAAICEAHLQERGASAQAYYLLGLVRDASGEASAVDCFRKALYLEPDHYESLLHLAFWWEKNGQPARARTFKSRAQRAKIKSLN